MKRVTFFLFLALTAHLAFGSAFNISEHGIRATGMGGAFIARASDPSAIFYNPAGIAFLNGKWIYVGGTLIAPTGGFEGENPFPGEGTKEDLATQYFPIPNFYFVLPISEKLTAGIGVYSPFGLGTKWENETSFTGRYITTDSSIKMITINPVIAVKLADNLSIGAGLEYSYSTVRLSKYLPLYSPFHGKVVDVGTVSMEGDWKGSLSFNAGILFKLSEKINIGLNYRHSQKVKYTGKANFSQLPTGNLILDAMVKDMLPFDTPADVEASIKYPSYIGGGIAYFANETLSFELDIECNFWSQYKELRINFPDHPDLNPSEESMREHYHNNITVRFGTEYALGEGTYLRAGYAYDQEAADAESVTPLLPDTTRHLISVGFGHKFSENFYFDISGIYLLGEKRGTEGKNPGGYEGTYSMNALLVGINFGYKF